MTLREWLAWGETELRAGPHPAKARMDAELLLLHHIGKSRAWLITHRDESYAGCSSIGFAELIKRRTTGEPVQYITGTCEFYGLQFHVAPHVLIPRPETEHLVEKALELARELPSPRILDVGTGSGAIAVAIKHHLSNAEVTACDISPEALAIASSNAAQNHCPVRLVESNLLSAFDTEQFDLIVSNPPYVPSSDRASLDVEVRDYEPALALFADEDGLAIFRRLILQSFAHLASSGYLLLEIGHGQHQAIESLLLSTGFNAIEFTPDLQGIPRVASARKP
ncbi:MAG: peptide chain release factor N(5)-glutamine methyltransferase [Acidobacteriota bacterium]|nr:peptide chain release factor N(5)-glutamine methyltransferase [Acidobacteriota bacterium]